MSVIAATGHRPDKLGGYDQKTRRALGALAVEFLHERRPAKVISGMAIGWDMAVAAAAVTLGIPFVAAVPFADQALRWPIESQDRYHRLLAQAHSVEYISMGYSAKAMQLRNEWMVNSADEMMALHDGSWGGTFNCLEYARKRGVPVTNLWDRWAVPEYLRALLA